MDGNPALDLWNLVLEVFHYNQNQSNKAKDSAHGDLLHRTTSSKRINEAVIKMIIKCRSPTKRHVTRTHRVALDWLFDRINLEPKIQIKYVVPKSQLADMPTNREFHT